jgi:hypothetical protein
MTSPLTQEELARQSPTGFTAAIQRLRRRIVETTFRHQNCVGPGGGMADTKVLEAFAVRCAGSSPVPGTKPIFRGKTAQNRI